MSPRSPHLLVVSLGSEPLPHVAATRPTRMGRELTDLGWDVSILSVDWSAPPPSPVPLAETVARALAEASPRVVGVDVRLAHAGFDPRAGPAALEPTPAWSVLRRARTFVNVFAWGPFPRWARLAYRAAGLLHAARGVDVTWAIHGDDSAHAVAHRLRRRLDVPWVADFKDPWNGFHPPAALPFQRWATRRRLRGAAAVTETCALQAAADGRAFERPTHVVYSGYDPELMAAAVPRRPAPGFSVAYLGHVAAVHDVRLLPELFVELKRRGSLESLTLHQYASRGGELRTLLKPYGVVRDHDRVPHAEAFALMRGADVLLVFGMKPGVGIVSVKELECLASGTPVLFLGEPLSEFSELVAACPQVCVARHAAEAADFLEAEAEAFRHGRPGRRGEVNPPALQPFTWSAQARRLAEVLTAASGRQPPR